MSLTLKEDNLITKSNKLIEASFKLNSIEQKIILALISLIQPDDEDFKAYTFRIKDFIKLIGGNSNTRYRELEEITRKLMSKVNDIYIDDRLYQVQWLSLAEYNYGKGTINLTLHPFLKPYLLQLKKEFTSYKLKNVSDLKSSYAIRIYELLKQYERFKERTFDLDDLRQKLAVTDIYPKYGNFKQRVLLPAQREINKKSDIAFDFKEIKEGRSVKQIKFLIKPNDDKVLENLSKQIEVLEQNMENRDINEIKQIATDLGLKIPKKIIQEWLKYGKENVIELMDSIKYRDDIKNPIGYISSVLLKKAQNQEEIIDYDPVQDKIREKIREVIQYFTPRQGSRKVDLLPDWLVKSTALDIFLKDMTLEEAERLWEEKKDEIMKEINNRRQKVNL